MPKARHALSLLVTLILLGVVPAEAAGLSDRIWFGGGLGFGAGDVDFVTVEPVVGFEAMDRLSVGVGLIYRYSDDDRFSPSLSTHDYGGNVFMRYRLEYGFFAQGEFEYLRYEFREFDGTKRRDSFESWLAGPGYEQGIGGNASFFAVALYNFNHDDDPSPYDDPWVYRVGMTFRF